MMEMHAGQAAFSKAGQEASSGENDLAAVHDNTISSVDVEDAEIGAPREEEYGVRNPRKPRDPKMPSTEEAGEHYLTHLPYTRWCQFCVQGKGKVAPPFKQTKREGGLMGSISITAS